MLVKIEEVRVMLGRCGGKERLHLLHVDRVLAGALVGLGGKTRVIERVVSRIVIVVVVC